jgi:hypothetical protein
MLLSAMSPAGCRHHLLSHPGSSRLRISLFCLAFFVAMGATACGHPATADECRVIVDRIVELELRAQKVSDPAEIDRRRRTSLGMTDGATPPNLLQDCIGRHLTDRAMECVRSAQTAGEISERCLR